MDTRDSFREKLPTGSDKPSSRSTYPFETDQAAAAGSAGAGVIRVFLAIFVRSGEGFGHRFPVFTESYCRHP